jgi:hypothetical protein
LNEAKQTGSITAGRFDADALDLAEGSHPGEHLPISLTRRCEALGSQNTITVIDNGRDMQIFVGVNAANDASLGWLLDSILNFLVLPFFWLC